MEELAVLAALVGATLRIATPIAYAALAATYSERAGVVNVGLEGMMLLGAFAGVVVSFATGSALLGVLAAMVTGVLVGAVLAVACITLRANQIVAGFGVNIAALGLTRFGLEVLFEAPGRSPSVDGLRALELPLVSNLPILGAVLRQHALVYVVIALVLGSRVLLRRTRFGRQVEAVGEAPGAAESAGLDVRRIRYRAVLISGALAGLGGVSLSLGQLTFFVQGMTAGRGFIGLAANILGRWSAVGGYGAALLFGASDALQGTLQNAGVEVPSELLLALPYLLTVVALAGLIGRSYAPSALGRPH